MARVFRPVRTIPIPANAERFTSREGEPSARFRRQGKPIEGPVTRAGAHAGSRIRVKQRCWAIEYTDAQGHVRRVGGFADKAATQAKAAELEKSVEMERAGIVTQRDRDVSGKLTAAIGEHVDAYDVHLCAANVSEWHRSETLRRLRAVLVACGFSKLADVTSEPVQRWLTLRDGEGMSARTRNTYTGSLRAFIRWAVADGRMMADPLSTLTKADEAGDVRRKRRALTEAELANLIRVAELRPLAERGRESVKRSDDAKGKPGPAAFAFLTLATIDAAAARTAERLRLKPAPLAKLRRLGRERSLIYRALVLTGLRRGELAALTWADLTLDAPASGPTAAAKPAPQAWLAIRAAVSKNGKAETLPIRADLADALRDWRTESGDASPHALVFNVPKQLVHVLARDLVAAGIARWVKGDDGKWRIDKRDADGRTIDVHALRHTTATYLAKAGVAPRTAQSIMRHSDIRLTLGTYTDPRLLDTAAALSALPSFGDAPNTDRLRATGTTDATAEHRPIPYGGTDGGTVLKTGANAATGFNSRTMSGGRATGEKPQERQGFSSPCDAIQDSGRTGSNRQHSAWKADALPIELRPRRAIRALPWTPGRHDRRTTSPRREFGAAVRRNIIATYPRPSSRPTVAARARRAPGASTRADAGEFVAERVRAASNSGPTEDLPRPAATGTSRQTGSGGTGRCRRSSLRHRR